MNVAPNPWTKISGNELAQINLGFLSIEKGNTLFF